MASLQPKNPIFHHFQPRNGSETAEQRLYKTAEKRSSARLALLLVVINDRGKFHLHRPGIEEVSRARVVVPPGAWSWVVTKYCRHPAYSDTKTHLLNLVDLVSCSNRFEPVRDVSRLSRLRSKTRRAGFQQLDLPMDLPPCARARQFTCTVRDRLFRLIKKNFLSTGPETRRKRSVCSRASKRSIERVPY